MSDVSRKIFFIGIFSLVAVPLFGQQVIDSAFQKNIAEPAYKRGKGPKILVDAAHNNGVRLNSSFKAIGNVLEQDGYRLISNTSIISDHVLQGSDILVIIDAMLKENKNHGKSPVSSAFRKQEIESINDWVLHGGSLLLVADHMPYAGAAQELAKNFNVMFFNGFAIDTLTWDISRFKREDHSLQSHPITNGGNRKEEIREVGSYFGQFMTSDQNNLTPILVFQSENMVCYLPEEPWKFSAETPTVPARNKYQGLAGVHGKGRIVILGDSSLMTAHLIGENKKPIGINSIEIKDNFQFALNIFHWLSYAID